MSNAACENCLIIYKMKPCKHIKLFNSKYGPDYGSCPCINCLVVAMCDKSAACDPYIDWLMGSKNEL